ncbi:hypothetical protein VU13_04460 [Desulfobulbus sp. US5]|nr:hypothetical protein [Desulfobulbus sp. US4]MCW5214541.1 hypothetical protein [Desulfobulbus sp. US5]WLE95775.1 MAG: hypothetical protein QTN59_13945 [Candidatus Electrothrix communis]
MIQEESKKEKIFLIRRALPFHFFMLQKEYIANHSQQNTTLVNNRARTPIPAKTYAEGWHCPP